MIHPVYQIIRGKYMVVATAITTVAGNVSRTVEIDAAVGPDMGFHIGDEVLQRKQRISRIVHKHTSILVGKYEKNCYNQYKRRGWYDISRARS